MYICMYTQIHIFIYVYSIHIHKCIYAYGTLALKVEEWPSAVAAFSSLSRLRAAVDLATCPADPESPIWLN